MMKMKLKKALVTGGAGFIGSHLVETLAAAGCQASAARMEDDSRPVAKQTARFM